MSETNGQTATRTFFERNRNDADLLREFVPNYRLPHTDKDGVPLKVGDPVVCECRGGSWINGERGLVLKLGVVSRAGECEGHLLQMDDCLTVAPVACLKKVQDD